MKKLILFLSITMVITVTSYAQAPQSINYQVIMRGNSGWLWSNKNVNIKFIILQDSIDGAEIYSEEHSTTTNVYGLLNVAIGSGSVLDGDFSTISWGNSEHYLRFEIDTTDGTNYYEMGISQLLSTPYALYSQVAGNVNYSDTSATNELQQFHVSGDTLFLINGNYVILPGVSPILQCSYPITDSRDGQQYSTVQIGDQCWMAENINIGLRIDGANEQMDNDTIEKYCYNDDPANCGIYGGLYKWDEGMQYVLDTGAQGICPSGWHIPTDDEWKILEGTADSQFGVGDPIWNSVGYRGFDAGFHLKSTAGWINNDNGDDSLGFAALPAGYRYTDGSFDSLNNSDFFWSSTEYNSTGAWRRHLHHNHIDIDRSEYNKMEGYSIRCLRND